MTAPNAGQASEPATGEPAAPPLAAEALTALAAMLSVAHAAVFACATAGGALAPSGDAGAAGRLLARNAYDAHRALRDSLAEAILSAGGEPPAARAAYTLPTRPVDPASALGLLADIEDRTAAAAYDAVAVLSAGHRQLAVDTLAGAAVRAQRVRLTAGAPPAQAGRPLPGR